MGIIIILAVLGVIGFLASSLGVSSTWIDNHNHRNFH